MALRYRLVSAGIFSFLILLCIGCGSDSGQMAPKPQGNYSNASLSGSYAFSISGTNTNGSSRDFFGVVGSMQANGNGSITGGTVDINSPVTGDLRAVSITGSYSVGTDGRGSAILNLAGDGSFHVGFVLTSTQHGLVTRFDNNATASGSFDLQNSSAFSLASLAGTFAFSISGVDSGDHPEVDAGVLTFDSSGNISGGVEDVNDFGSVSQNLAINPITAGVTTPSATTGRGTITINGFTYAYYVISTNRASLLEIDSSGIALSGDAFRQTSTAISGAYVFSDAGTTNVPYSAVGVLNTDGAGTILNTSMEDINNGGTVTQLVPVSGNYSAISGGRGTLTLNAGLAGTTNFAIYPSVSGILAIQIDSFAVTNAIAVPQQAGPFSTGSLNGTYGLNLSGANNSSLGEIDATAQFTANGGGSLTGAMDLNNGGSLASNLAMSGTYTIGSNGRGTATLQTSAGPFNLVFYIGSSSNMPFVELATNEVAIGTIQQQH